MNLFYTQDRPNPRWWITGKPNEYFTDVNKTFMGRDALNVILTHTNKKKVLLPAYNCNEVIYEFEKKHCEIYYYDINQDFTIDSEKVIELISLHKIELFYHIIYFGFEQVNRNLNQAVKLAFPDVFIIEDRAHYLSNKYQFNYCDAYLFSFRKLLPIAEGGGFISKQKLEFLTAKTIQANILPVLMYFKKKILGYNDSFNRTALTKNRENKSVMPMSLLSKNLIEKYDYQKEIEFRRDCFNRWISKLGKTNIQPVFTKIEINDIPQGCPVYVSKSEDIQAFMKKQNYYLRRHWKIREELQSVAPGSYWLSNRVITLPVYTGITEEIQNNVIDNLLKYHEHTNF